MTEHQARCAECGLLIYWDNTRWVNMEGNARYQDHEHQPPAPLTLKRGEVSLSPRWE